MRDLLAADQTQQTRLPAAVWAQQRRALARAQRELQRREKRAVSVVDREIAQLDEPVGVKGQLRELERVGLLEISQQALFFLDRELEP